MRRTLQEVVGLLCIDAIACPPYLVYKGKIQKQQKLLDTEAKEMECAFEMMKMVGLLCIDAIACRPYLGRKASIIKERFNNNKNREKKHNFLV